MKKIMFLTGTRVDFGHQKPLIDKCIEVGYEVFIFITGMHLDDKYGYTYNEIHKYGYNVLSDIDPLGFATSSLVKGGCPLAEGTFPISSVVMKYPGKDLINNIKPLEPVFPISN